MKNRKMRNWPLDKKILSNISIAENGCWIWQMSKHPSGYGNLYFNGAMAHAHRASWVAFRGEIPKGMHVLHKCDVRDCVNPNHLFLGTHQDNMTDMKNKGRCMAHKGEKNWNARLTDKQVAEIRSRYKAGEKQTVLAKEFGVYQGSISAICRMASRKEETK